MGGLEILALIALAAQPARAALVTPTRWMATDSLSAPAAGPAPAERATTASPTVRPEGLTGAPPDTVSPSRGAARDSLPLRLRDAGVAAAGRPGAELVEPSGIACDAFGKLYVSDASLHRLARFAADGGWLGSSGALGSDAEQLHRPGAVALLGTLNVALLDRENLRVVTYDLFGHAQGTLIDLAAADLVDALGRVDPTALAADRGGAVYVLDQDRDRVLVFDFSGRFLRSLGGFGPRPGSFRGLAGVAVAPGGQIVTAERGGARLQRLDPSGSVAATWPLSLEPGRLAVPLAVDDSARVAVADERRGRLWLFDRGGRLLAETGGLELPRALAFAPDGTLLVAEAGAGLVRRFAIEHVSHPPVARDR